MATTSRTLALWVACVAQLLVVLDISVVNVALPSIQADLAMGPTQTTWVALAYGLGFAGALLVGARLADVLGTGRVLSWGLGAFTLAGTVGGLATDGSVLVGARAVQGLCAAVVSPATFTLLTTTNPEGPARTRAVAAWTAVSLAGGGVGNILSGALTELVSWRAVLLVNLPIGLAVLAGAAVLRRRFPDAPGHGRLDLVGAVLATGGFTCATYALSAAGGHASAAWAGAAALAGVVLFVLLAAQQRRTAHRLVPRGLLRNRLVVRGNVATALTAACFQVGLWYFLTYRMQGPMGFSPMRAGLGFLPLTSALLVVNTWITPRLMARVPSRTLVALGAVSAAAGLAWQAFAVGDAYVLAVLGPSLVVGVGGGLLTTPLATMVTTGVPAEDAGAASGLMNTAKQFGGALGLAAATAATALAGTDGAAFLLMGALVGTVALLAFRLPSPRERRASGAPVYD
ncbi:MFS transporter [Nocardiopsis sp. EMB25]|uniref:MFS transporter n=1 Tax=Nocardiopsis sp. EMB25 TaxID=2835867 RepID=UPI002283AB2C|nr:MFS transporter [Nocardiopsis sp. EMB25]MCY9783374.1 MFS transporter [Nocardiopsis sp. EMB25]